MKPMTSRTHSVRDPQERKVRREGRSHFILLPYYISLLRGSLFVGSLKRRRRCQRERQKSNRFRLAKPQLCTCITLFCTFLIRRFTTTTLKCQISRFVEDGNSRQQLLILFLNFDTVLENSTPNEVANI